MTNAPSGAQVFGTGGGVGAHETGVFFNRFCKLPRLKVSRSPRFTVTVILVSVPFPFPLFQLLTPPLPHHRNPPPRSIYLFTYTQAFSVSNMAVKMDRSCTTF